MKPQPMPARATESADMTAGYQFGFLLEQSLGHITHTKNLVANVALDPEVNAHWGLIDFEAAGIAGKLPVYRSNWETRRIDPKRSSPKGRVGRRIVCQVFRYFP